LSDNYNLTSYLNEIEKITDLNGCFFINVKDDEVIESTIPFKVPEKILWEIGVLRDTFRQFSHGINHGALNELMIEGDKGYILLYDIPPHLLLLAMGSDEVNLSYVKLAMIDILERIRSKIADMGDEILKIPGKKFGALGEKAEKIPTQVSLRETDEVQAPVAKAAEKISAKKEVKPEKVPIESLEVEASRPEVIKTEGSEAKKESIPMEHVEKRAVKLEPIEEAPSQETVIPQEDTVMKLKDMIESLKDTAGTEKYETLRKIFDNIKQNLQYLSGNELFKVLEELKDVILLNIGTSLALYDISKTAKGLKKIQRALNSDESIRIGKSIENWKQRIIKT
jgi:predicted regulator of Ras-like GTPase activity (Roadblock/LC7/MglB family)